MNMCITKKSVKVDGLSSKREGLVTLRGAKRSQVWTKFLELRKAGKRPILMDTAGGREVDGCGGRGEREPGFGDSDGGWSYVCVPDEVQPEVGGVGDDGGGVGVGGDGVGADVNGDGGGELRFLDEFCRLACRTGPEFTGLELHGAGEQNELSEPPFIGGWVGFMTYNQGVKWMGVKSRHECKLPLMWWRFCREVYAFQVVEEDLTGELCAHTELHNDFCKMSKKSPGIVGLAQELQVGLTQDFIIPDQSFIMPGFKVGELKSNVTWEEYERGISEVKRLLRDGETYQVNFAQEFSGDFEGDAFGLYAKLFQMNPVRMGFFAEGDVAGGYGVGGAEDAGGATENVHVGSWAVCSNSPERLVSLRVERVADDVNGKDGEVRRTMRAEPIKGTVARDEDPEFLLRDKKSYAELTMIVDLMRNDLGRVAKVGSVKVPEHQALMELKNVWHTYSVIEAELAEDKMVADMIRAVFPGGSIVGCPKKRTMEIIDRLVDFSWGAYCGSAGYVSLNGNADFNIMIRTAQVVGDGVGGGRRVSFGAGGGIVMDSDAAAEYQETMDKAGIFRRAVREAE